MQGLYKADPKAKGAVDAARYAVFSNMGVTILVTPGKEQGIAVDHKSKGQTPMKMLELRSV